MTTTLIGAAAAIPFGYDLFPLDDDVLPPPLPTLEDLQSTMIAAADRGGYSLDEEQILGLNCFPNNSSHDAHQAPISSSSSSSFQTPPPASLAISDVAKSPAKPSHLQISALDQHNQYMIGVASQAAARSLSPGTSASLVFTPTSTLLDYNPSNSDGQDQTQDDTDDLLSASPGVDGNVSPTTTDDFVLVSSRDSGEPGTASAGRRRMNNHTRPPTHTSSASGEAPDRHSPTSSVAPSSSTNPSFSGVQWGSFNATTNGWMDPSNNFTDGSGLPSSYVFDNSAFSQSDLTNELLSNIDPFDHGDATTSNAIIPFRAIDATDNVVTQHNYTQSSPLYMPYLQTMPQQGDPAAVFAQFQQQQRQQQHHQQQQQQRLAQQLSENQLAMRGVHDPTDPSRPTILPQYNTFHSTLPSVEQTQLPSQASSMSGVVRRAVSTARTSPYPNQAARSFEQPATSQNVRRPQRQATPSSSTSTAVASSSRTIARAEPTTVPSNALDGPSQSERGRRGGRQKHSHLSEPTRAKSHLMRKLAACWRCALQRDPCDEGTPCGRCQMRSQRGQTYYFDCDRSKLPDFVHDFLPPSMTLMHQKQTIEDTVNEHILQWDRDNPIDVYLTSGYGPALRWKLYEFRPKTEEYLGQLQYFQNPETGICQRFQKYSPPFAIMKLDASDDSHFEEYLEQLLHPDYLWEFGWTCFEEETQVDPGAFQAKLLQLMCTLYLETGDKELHELLKEILRMMIITYIMGHTLTIEENTVMAVLSSVKLTPRHPQNTRFTSPRLANRQLKFFFSVQRNALYEKILKWQQQTLHTSGKKEATWLPAFCAMLGFAMVLEEVQRLIQIQADAKVAKNEMPLDQANTEARNACERIDTRFRLLIGLFQCKYRDRTWGAAGSFGAQTPELSDTAATNFLSILYHLVLEKCDHLESRKDVSFAPENQCRYTSRLVARFLLPFLQLPS